MGWLTKVLTDVSQQYSLSNEKAKILLRKILSLIYNKNNIEKEDDNSGTTN